MPNVCPECDRPIYFRKKDKPELMKCYVCKKWVKPIKRGYKKANRYAVCKRWDEIPRRRKTFISDSDLVSHDELVERLKEYKANNKRLTKRNKALIAILYLTGARVEEITGMIDQVTREKVTEPLKLNQMEFKLMDGDMYLVFDRLRVLKRKPRKDASGNPQEIVRRVPVLVQDDTYMVACIKEYVHSFKRVALDMPLFKITYQRAWQISNVSV